MKSKLYHGLYPNNLSRFRLGRLNKGGSSCLRSVTLSSAPKNASQRSSCTA